jgi:REP element-mobilizing transposase RayT
MPDHYHVICTLLAVRSVSALVRRVHGAFAATCRKTTPIQGRIFQTRFYDHVIRGDRELSAQLEYMEANPVRAGLAESVEDYPWSSWRYWHLGTGEVRCDPWK